MKLSLVKPLFILLIASICFISCKTETNKTCCEDIQKLKDSLKSEKKTININPLLTEKSFDSLYIAYKPKQKTVLTNTRDLNRYKLTNKSKNYFNVTKDLINVEIPITTNKLKIVNVINVSSKKINAIVILLDGNNSKKTNKFPVTHSINSQINISKISGLSKKNLTDDKELKVFILHNDKFDLVHDFLYKLCVITYNDDYKEGTCIDSFIDPFIEKIRPEEEEGSILTLQ